MNRHQYRTSIVTAAAMLVLILDAKTALTGAKEGVTLCLYTIIPSLFPFFLISILLNNALVGRSIPLLRPLGKLCGIPKGSESILILGLVGGYPVGAQCISQAYHAFQLSRHDARRLLGFCNNAGPAFLFGMMAGMFTSPVIVWILWFIHIVSAILVGILLPGKSRSECAITPVPALDITQALDRAIKIMSQICGWVILFRVIICFLDRWFLWMLPQVLQVFLTGVLELSNGCCALYDIASEDMRFTLASCLLAFGGCCVVMQTSSATKGLGLGLYLPGKLLQVCFSLLFSQIAQTFLFPNEAHAASATILAAFAAVIIILTSFLINKIERKKTVAIQ